MKVRPVGVVIGTGTDVGKTHLALALLLAAKESGWELRACKPFETGGDDIGDGDRLLRAGHPFHVQHRPQRFRAPIAPPLAARAEGRLANASEALTYVAEVSSTGPTLVETAGGLFSPIAEDQTCWDLATAMDPTLWILVAPNRLGVLHDARATVGYAQALGRKPDVLVLSRRQLPDASAATNANELRRTLAMPIVELPFAAPGDAATTAAVAPLLARLRDT